MTTHYYKIAMNDFPNNMFEINTKLQFAGVEYNWIGMDSTDGIIEMELMTNTNLDLAECVHTHTVDFDLFDVGLYDIDCNQHVFRNEGDD